MSKPTRTQLNIKSINSYINKIGSTFGVNSKQYQKITNEIANAELNIYTNKKGFIQVQNTKVNRTKHQTIRAINARKTPFFIVKRKHKNDVKQALDYGLITLDDIQEQGSSFGQWFSEMTQDINDLLEEVYKIGELCEKYGLDFDFYECIKNSGYRASKWRQIYDAMKEETLNDVAQNEYGQSFSTVTGEVFESSSDDFVNPDFFD